MFAHDRIVVRTVDGFSCADSVDGDFSVLRAADRLFEGDAAGVVLAVADDHKNSGHGLGFRAAGELIGGEGDGIPKSGASGRHELADGMGE